MTISTNAGFDDRLSPAERRAAALDDHHALVSMEGEEKGRRAAARRTRQRIRLVPFEAQQGVQMDVDGDGELTTFDNGVALEFEFDEPVYDENVPNLGPYIIGGKRVECAWWPFKPKGARAGLRPCLGPKAWEAILDDGMYCLRCLWRHESAWPEDGCTHCFLTALHRQRALDHIERAGELWQTAGPNRAQRRAQQRRVKRSNGGVVLPGMAFAPGS